ncbi:hypothetical protein HJ590_16040 [Naumannella sp. ID2617S]|uniref:Uncharacterized protein n=1 Tax=Enemella dayhoffiae TaxID=2016507 RepID=A0A255H7E2_9ACTN|nr:hypothetical protein [Enemella dayhoffiae]NNG21045.1 hypothetical protein [Naumannella sp. ID2617S]OYO23487.1 hypothetical protein CGZ93_05985 [Enemella dayhoffiae]
MDPIAVQPGITGATWRVGHVVLEVASALVCGVGVELVRGVGVREGDGEAERVVTGGLVGGSGFGSRS